MDPTKFLLILSLNVILLTGRVKEIDGSIAAFSVTGVVADLDAVNTTALHLIWDSQLKPDNITIDRYVIEVNNAPAEEMPSDNETSSYSHTIIGLAPGVNYSVTLIVVYNQESEATTVAPALRESITLQESIYLFNNTYPMTPSDPTLIGRDTKSLTFTWYQEGKADACYMWTDNAPTTATDCYFHSNGSVTGTISDLPVAGKEYTVQIAAVSGGLNSGEVSTTPERTLPPNPSAPQCISQTNASFTFRIPPPYDHSPDSFELHEYEFVVQSLIDFFPCDTTRIVAVVNKSEILVTIINDPDIAAGVTYGITLTTGVAGVSSADSNSSNCATEPNIPLISGIVDTTEVMVNATWQTPSGYFDGFKVSCPGLNSAKNDFAIKYQNQTSSGTPQTLNAECHNVTAGALYQVNVVSIILNQSLTSKASDSVFNVTVPYAPKKVEPTNATTTNFIQLSVTYGYTESDSQCTHFEISNLSETGTVEETVIIPASNPTVEFLDLTADSPYNFNTSAVSNYTQLNSTLWRRSSNSTPAIAWTLSPSVSNITELERRPWSLLVQFDQTDPHEHVFKYTIHVDAESGRFKTIDLMCDGATDEALHTLNCDPTNSDVQTIPIDCGTMSSCDATTAYPRSARGVAEVTTVTGLKARTTRVPNEVPFSDSNWDARLLEDSTAQSICFNISGLEPYINYSISVQAVNPGGCSVKESVALITEQSIPGCVNLTYTNSSFNSIEVHWNPPDKPNGIITQYVINYTRQDGKPTLGTNPITTTDTFCIIEPLEPYVAYNITVAAETSVGVGASSGCPLSNTVATTSIAKPYQPYLQLYAISSISINISWTLARDVETGPETYYNLTITDAVDVTLSLKEHVEGFYNRFIVVDGLDEYWEYRVKIVAYTIDENEKELSTEATTDYIRTLQSTPGPVQSLNVTSLSSENKSCAALVEWTEPTVRDRNGIITGYQLTWNETEQTFSPDTRSAEVTVEPNDKSYTFTIMAATSVGLGAPVSSFLNSTGICEDPCDFYTGATTISSGTSSVRPVTDKPCFDRPCRNGATCVENCTTFSCICTEGFTGYICDEEINECETIPCYPFGDCEDLIGGYNCSCNPGYETIPDNDTMCIETDFCANEDQPCYNDGTCVNQNALGRYYCICPVVDGKQYVGLKCETELITRPTVNNGGISPTSGIIAGGANVTVRGQEMDLFEPLGAYLIDTTSNPLHSQYAFVIPNLTQSDSITVQIPPVGSDYINRSLLVFVEYSGPINVTNATHNLRFKYTGNPVIHAIEPTDILVTGGVRLTVYGSNMDTAQNPLMDITTYVVNTTGHRETNFSRQSCLEKNETAITFLVPYGIVPPSFINNTATAGKSFRGVFHLDSSFRPKKSRRTKRAPVGNLTDESGNTFEMYLGFIFDGFPTYNNISKSLPNITLNFVPIRASFNANCYMDFVTNKMDTIILKGTELSIGCSKEDYTVLISNVTCNVTSLTDNELQCRPQKDEPTISDPSLYCAHSSDPHPVQVTVGGKTQHACCVSYTVDNTDLIIVVTVTCVVVVAIIILVAVLLYKRHKKNKVVKNANYRASVKSKDENEYDSVVGQPNGNDDAVLTHDRSYVGANHGKQTNVMAMAMAPQRDHPTAVQPDHDDYMQPRDIPAAVFDNHGGMGDTDIRGDSSGRTHDSYANAGLYGHRGEQHVEAYGVAIRRQRAPVIDNNLMEVDPEIDY